GIHDAGLKVADFATHTTGNQSLLKSEIEELGQRANALSTIFEKSAANIYDLSAKTVENTQQLETAIHRQTTSMSEAAAGALAQTTEAGRAFETRARSLAKIAADALAEAETHMANARAVTLRDVEAASEASTRAVW